ncbi:pilus assembly protein N-terminal domain-containing protein [Candidatus Liberibacter africanus]|uniref:Pilus formation protein N-terminal domain-containing protein n=1 Tax=Candidatus Liberibacter africanus PTSAPSY TaxID=1277257 RepID=A0A0G3I8H8_LIBAF|nr:pilus assembly protein N-terminal domain-containing protein [Candidatus Liberibacter africanus]AKK20032.1 hypothetical protein G293_02000 [Candidatus Liberibacter africanus PTSAPSY]QTP63859.1 pilus assembly protein N-terminal domain-containing protein [Candidatus Liberibacter africanus]
MANIRTTLALSIFIFIVARIYPAFPQDQIQKAPPPIPTPNYPIPDKKIIKQKPPLLPTHRNHQEAIKHANPKTKVRRIPPPHSPINKTLPTKPHEKEEAKNLRVAIGQSLILGFNTKITKVVVGNEKVIDVLALETENSVVVTGKEIGITNLIVLGKDNKVILDIEATTFANEKNTVRVYSPGNKAFLSCTPRCLPYTNTWNDIMTK